MDKSIFIPNRRLHWSDPLNHRLTLYPFIALSVFLGTVAPATEAADSAKPSKKMEAEIEPAARAVMKRMSEAYAGIYSLSAEIRLTLPTEKKEQVQTSFVYQHPNRFAITRRSENRTLTALSDGQSLFISSDQVKDRYVKVEAQPSRFGLTRQLAQLTGTEGFRTLLELLNGESLLPPENNILSLKLEKPVGEKDDSFDTVRGVVGKFRQPEAHVTYRIAKSDGLLRELSIQPLTEKVKLVEMYSEIQLNPQLPLDRFAFKIPPSAQAVSPPLGYDARLKRGAKAIPIRSKDMQGRPISLDQYKGKVTLIYFWGTWCPACMMEMPEITSVYRKYRDKGFDVVGIPLENEIHKIRVTTALKRRALPWRQAFEGKREDNAIAIAYGVESTPLSVLIDRQGEIVAVGLRGEKELEAAVQLSLGTIVKERKASVQPSSSGTISIPVSTTVSPMIR